MKQKVGTVSSATLDGTDPTQATNIPNPLVSDIRPATRNGRNFIPNTHQAAGDFGPCNQNNTPNYDGGQRSTNIQSNYSPHQYLVTDSKTAAYQPSSTHSRFVNTVKIPMFKGKEEWACGLPDLRQLLQYMGGQNLKNLIIYYLGWEDGCYMTKKDYQDWRNEPVDKPYYM